MELRRVLIPVNGEGVDEEAVKLGCVLGRRSKGVLYVVYLVEVRRSLPLNALSEADAQRAQDVLARVEQMAHSLDCAVETGLLPTREMGPAIVEEAVERRADVIVMATGYRRRFGEFDMGTVVPHVFKHAPCRVLLWRAPMGEGKA